MDPKTEKYIKAALRRIWGWYSERKKARNRALVRKDMTGEWFRCEQCGATPVERRGVEIDHVEEVANPAGWDGWGPYIERLFCPADGLMVLCRPCHKGKSAANQKLRRAAKKAAKK